ncbi:MAG: hypothetical protein U0234_15305 [Sandaracinus sp.]
MHKRWDRGYAVVIPFLFLAACGSGTSETRSTENAPPPASTSGTEPAPTSGTEQHCTEIDPWSQSGEREVPCQPASGQPVLDPFHGSAAAS